MELKYHADRDYLTPYNGWTVDVKIIPRTPLMDETFEIWLKGPTTNEDRKVFTGKMEDWGFREWVDRSTFKIESNADHHIYLHHLADLRFSIRESVSLFGLQRSIDLDADIERYLTLRWGRTRYLAFKSYMEEKTGKPLAEITLELALDLEHYK